MPRKKSTSEAPAAKKSRARTPPFSEYPTWSEARFWGFLRSALRSAWSKWPPKYEVLAEAKRPYTGSNKLQKWEFLCTKCGSYYKQKDVSVDHIIPAGSLSSWEDIPEFASRLFVGKDQLRVLCNTCHQRITNIQKKSARTSHPREESTYRNMLSRCYNPRATGYENYGGKGVKVCDRWRESFWNFYEDMGNRPEKHTLDRISVDGDYTPDNCRWASWEEQANNKSDTVYLEFDNETLSLSMWARKVGIMPNTLLYRLQRGWSVDEALGYTDRVLPSKKRLQGELLTYVRREVAAGRSQSDVAREIGVDSSTISRALSRES